MKTPVQDLDGKGKWEAIVLQGHMRAEVVASRWQRQPILVAVVHPQFLYFHISSKPAMFFLLVVWASNIMS